MEMDGLRNRDIAHRLTGVAALLNAEITEGAEERRGPLVAPDLNDLLNRLLPWPTDERRPLADWVRAQEQSLDEMRNSPERVRPEYHQTKWASDCAIDFISQDHDQPWLLNINIYDPHPPFIPPAEYAEQFDPNDMPGPYFKDSDIKNQKQLERVDFQDAVRTPEEHNAKDAQAKYYAMIAQIDDQLARILQTLDETGQRDNTVIIFTSDHGETLGDHGLMFKGCRFYEGLVKVPLIFSFPKQFKQNKQCAGLVELLDLSATLLELSGVDIPDAHQGKSLLPFLQGDDPGSHIRDHARCEYFDALDPYFTGGTGSFATMHRDERYKLVVYHGHNIGELFDLQDDPDEYHNLWDSPAHQEIRFRLMKDSFDALAFAIDRGPEQVTRF